MRSPAARSAASVISLLCAVAAAGPAPPAEPGANLSPPDGGLIGLLDAPLLFVKRHSYRGIHIYDTYYKWAPGGGIYVIENPSAPPGERKVRAVIDPTTPETLGEGIYSEPDISWDGRRVLFCFKGSSDGNTCIYEIGVDGKGLRQLTDPKACCQSSGRFRSHHDVGPAYLPDGRIVFTSTRPNGLVPCFNSGVDILHVMNADGSGIHPISVNNVNEFDPCVLADGRILFGRWEYVDKTALTQQSVWTVFPDGTNETALFANNMVHPEAVLDARPVPGCPDLVVATFTPHNAPPRGTIAFIDVNLGKNSPGAIRNLEYPDAPTRDRGESCEPWPLSRDVVVFSGRPRGCKRNAIEILDRSGRREVVHAEADICCHSPMPVKPRRRPPTPAAGTRGEQRAGRFFVQDVYQGLPGVRRGEVKLLRVIEETSRTTGTHGGAFNQTFVVSGVLAWSAKNFLGVAPIEADGSAYFEVPSGRAVYLQAIDGEGRLVQSMRTFVQAAGGVTRSCVGCHEYKYGAPAPGAPAQALRRDPSRLEPESWGGGYLDYPSMVQPVFDRHCVRCHGGREGFGGRLDLSGGWTEYFSISYENLISRRETQLTAYLIAGIDCMNGTSHWSARIFGPRSHGSGAAPLARVLVGGHKGRIRDLGRTERDLVLAWIDTNGLYHGTWNYSKHGCRLRPWRAVRGGLIKAVRSAGCSRCHGDERSGLAFEDDWANLRDPEFSRLLRAPLAKEAGGLALCRDRKVDPNRRRLRILWSGYAHAAAPLTSFPRHKPPAGDESGEPVVTFASIADEDYQAMLAIIRSGREQALAAPRIDMPGASRVAEAGRCRLLVPPALPDSPPALRAAVDGQAAVHLEWDWPAGAIGLTAEVHRGAAPDFAPSEATLLASAPLGRYVDAEALPGTQHYALVLRSGDARSAPARASADVPSPPPPPRPNRLAATPGWAGVSLTWQAPLPGALRYHVYRAQAGQADYKRLTDEPIADVSYVDGTADEGRYSYVVRAVGRRGEEGEASAAVEAAPLRPTREPVFVADLSASLDARLVGGRTAKGASHGRAALRDEALDLRRGGHVTYAHRAEFDLPRPISVACWVYFDEAGSIPVILSCGFWNKAGWFLQKIGHGWRWHVGGISADGGRSATGKWFHLAGTFDGRKARLFENGLPAGEASGNPIPAAWDGPLCVGQYGEPGPTFQVTGRIARVKVYRRVLTAKEVAELHKAGPPKLPAAGRDLPIGEP